MMRCTILSVVITAGLLWSCAEQGTQVQALSQADKDAMTAVIETYDRAALERDAPTFAALFAEHALFIRPDDTPISGREAIRQWFPEAAVGLTELTDTPVEVGGMGDTGYVHTTFTVTFSPEGADPVSWTGNTIWLFKRTENGSWLIQYLIFNRDHALSQS